jgi:hypothetical protein
MYSRLYSRAIDWQCSTAMVHMQQNWCSSSGDLRTRQAIQETKLIWKACAACCLIKQDILAVAVAPTSSPCMRYANHKVIYTNMRWRPSCAKGIIARTLLPLHALWLHGIATVPPDPAADNPAALFTKQRSWEWVVKSPVLQLISAMLPLLSCSVRVIASRATWHVLPAVKPIRRRLELILILMTGRCNCSR